MSDKSKLYLEELSNFIFTSKYARYNEKLQRRETWTEAVERLEKMHLKKFSYLDKAALDEIKWAFSLVKDKRLSPSMRSLQFGGKAIEAHNARIFNCAVRHVDSMRSFSEIFYLLLCGCGVGIGLSNFFLNRLPRLVGPDDKTGTVISYTVEDTIEGWADSIEALLNCYFKNTAYTGRKIVFDYSKIRKKGAPLKTGGGKAPGYKGLKLAHKNIKNLLDYIIEELHETSLGTVHSYDILMHCADAVLSGGIRRSATSIIFQPDDLGMINAKTYFEVTRKFRFEKNEKTGKYEGAVIVKDGVYNYKDKFEVELSEWEYNELLVKQHKISWSHIFPHRARSNNSVILLRDKVTYKQFVDIIKKTQLFGEPGFVFANDWRTLYNPCFEVGFIPITKDGVCGVQFCNLTSANGAKIKSLKDLLEVSHASAIIGTLQAAYTYFPYLSKAAQILTEEEALLGCSMTGLMDNPDILLNAENQRRAAAVCVQTNKVFSKKIGINQAARVTNIKPEGTNSLIMMSGSGIHAHHGRRYLRRVQCNKLDNVYKFFKKHNPHMIEESVWSANKTDDVITFPVEVGPNVMIKDDLNALKHLELIKSTQINWVQAGTTEVNKKDITHNVSCTVIIKDDEWEETQKFIFDNKEYFSAVSMLPYIGDKLYKQAPLEKIVTEEDEIKWNNIINKFVNVDYTQLIEVDDETALQQEMSCAGGACEVQIDEMILKDK